MSTKTFIISILSLLPYIGNAQSPQTIASMADFEYYAVENTYKQASVDSTRFIVSKPTGREQAVLIFVQGSGNQSIIFDNGKLLYALTETLMDRETLRKYRLVLIAKPGVPLSSSNELANVVYEPTWGQYDVFCRNSFLDYHIDALRQTVEHLKGDVGVQLPIYIVGHSQGYKVCARFAAEYPQLVSKVVCLSNSPFANTEELTERYNELLSSGQWTLSQLADSIRSLNQPNENTGKPTIELAHTIPPITSIRPETYWCRIGQQSFNVSVLGDMLRIQCPLLVCYGSNDPLATLSGLLPTIFREEGKENLTLQRFEHYNHQFEYQQVDSNGILIESEPRAAEVYRYIDSWLSR